MALFGPAWMSKNPRRACKAVARIDDEETLLLVATSATTYEAREKAVGQLQTLEAVRQAIDSHNGYWHAANERLRLLKGRKVLETTIGLDDQEALARTVAQGPTPEMALASEDLFDRHSLGMGVWKDAISAAALDALIDEKAVLCVVLETPQPLRLRKRPFEPSAEGDVTLLVDRLTNEEDLVTVARDARHDGARRSALAKLSAKVLEDLRGRGEVDEAFLERSIAMVGGFVCQRCQSINKPSAEQHDPCRCRSCREWNHRYRYLTAETHEVLGSGLTLLPGDIYCQCTRCGDVSWTGMREGDC